MKQYNRRDFLKYCGATAISTITMPSIGREKTNSSLLQKHIPSSRQLLTVIGMGTWQTFNVGSDPKLRDSRTAVLDLFFELGGQMVDSSPMYGSSQQVIGHGLTKLNYPENLFSADKIWTSDESATMEQFQETASAWRLNQFDLMQVHNLVSWRAHLDVLKQMKNDDELKYIGVTTSHGRRHRDLEKIMLSEPIDFVQLTYSMANRDVEQRLLPIAQERGIAVIANRPFQGGRLIDHLQRKNAALPRFAHEIQSSNWAQYLLKYVVSHPAITCAIPATTQLEHMRENMGAARGILPDSKMRQQMLAYVNSI